MLETVLRIWICDFRPKIQNTYRYNNKGSMSSLLLRDSPTVFDGFRTIPDKKGKTFFFFSRTTGIRQDQKPKLNQRPLSVDSVESWILHVLCTGAHVILSFLVVFSRLFFLYLFLGISSCFGVANEEKEKARSENGTEKVKNVEHRNWKSGTIGIILCRNYCARDLSLTFLHLATWLCVGGGGGGGGEWKFKKI